MNTVIAEGVTSVRDHPAFHWRQLSLNHTTVPQLFTDLLEALGDLDGPAEEWDRDVWRPERLGYSIEERRQVAPLDFTGITQSWLRERTRRYMRLRLVRTELRSVARNVHDVVVFSRFIAESRPDQQNDAAVLDRALLESYIGWVGRRTVEKKGPHYGQPVSPGSRIRLLSVISTMLETWRRYGWQPVLPPDARIHRDEYPRQRGLKANFIDEYLMDQIESEENLALLDPETRTLVLICRDEGLRIGEALTLKTDCLKKTPSGRWALVHYKSKDKSFRAIPASRVVVDAIRGQHGRVRERFSDGCHWLFPKVSGNPDGKYPMPYGTVDTRFDAWLKRIRLVDSNGDAAIVNWHQFRHTLGTRMANAGVSGRTIREVLGHTSWETQEHYSRIADDTLRREYEEKYEVRFNLKGEAVKVRRDADLSGVEWLAEKIGRRLHAVAGGWCGRHIARPCPKTAADGCYFCEDFQTDRQFLPIHLDTSPALARCRPVPLRQHVPALSASMNVWPPPSSMSSRASPTRNATSWPRQRTRAAAATRPLRRQPMRADNSTHLAEAAQQRRLDCIARVQAALDSLERNGGPVTVAGVASRAGVSRTFLYDDAQSALLARLRALASRQPTSGRPALPDKERITTKSHEAIVRALRGANRKLNEDNERLRTELAVALGQLRDLRRRIPTQSAAQRN
ncbi:MULTISPECIES: DUF6262 family protein [unclassified Kitasatospora]|uniref:DUF6262 family protein n=1 Tax=unclassified Kitasatospora TaxID=2633591 RepID=UPI00138F25FA|nr:MULTISPECIES: DUF6262 family protein [unclassified Kitasatospora]